MYGYVIYAGPEYENSVFLEMAKDAGLQIIMVKISQAPDEIKPGLEVKPVEKKVTTKRKNKNFQVFDENEDDIRKKLTDGVKQKDIADGYGINPASLSAWIRARGFTGKPYKHKVLDNKKKEIKKYLKHGLSQVRIAREYGVSEYIISKWMKANGIDKPSKKV